MHDVSIAFLTIPDVDPVKSIQIAHKTGFQKAGIRLMPALRGEREYPLLSSKSVLAEVLAILAGTGISVGEVELVRIGAGFKKENYFPLFEVSQQLGARDVTVIIDDSDFSRAADSFSMLCESAQQYGLFLNLEPIPWTALRDLREAITIVQLCRQKNAGILIDAFHFYRRHTNLDLIGSIPPSWLRIVQICDAPRKFIPDKNSIRTEARTARLFPGEGEFDLTSFLKAFPDRATISIEVPNKTYLDSYTAEERAQRAYVSITQLIKNTGRIHSG